MMRLPLPSLFLSAAALALLAGDPAAYGAPQPLAGKRLRVDEIEQNRPNADYKIPKLAPDSFVSDDYKNLTKQTGGDGYMPQSDAFQMAAEQATYLQAYQLMYGPYGRANTGSPAEKAVRDEKIKKGAQAIDDCVNNRNCNADKQKIVLEALVQYNFGRDLRRINLTAASRREGMRSLVPAEEQMEGTSRAFEAMKNGSSIVGGSRKAAALPMSRGTARAPYYQLDRAKVEHPVGEEELKILGPRFIQDYGIFVRANSGGKRDAATMARYYKFVKAKDDTYINDPTLEVGDKDRMEENIREHGSKEIQGIVEEHLKTAKAPAATPNPQKPREYFVSGERGQSAGFMKTVDVYKNGADGKPTTEKMESYDRYPVIADNLNRAFKETAEKKQKDEASNGRGIAQSGASVYGGNAAPKDIASNVISEGPVGVTLSPERFDNFLNEIWPTAKERAAILKN